MRYLLTVLAYLALAACGGSETTWQAKSRSPDSAMIATAKTIENSGFGTGSIATVVDLNFASGSQSPTEILVFPDGPNIPHSMEVGMHWLSPHHLELTYRGARMIDFQAAKFHGVDISVRDVGLSGG